MNKIDKPLYCLNKDGSIQEWKVTVSGDTFTVHYGKLGGKIQTKTTTCTGKNIGRSNETSATEQSRLEAESKWDAQYRKGYREDTSNLSVDKTQVMLANDASKRPQLIKYPCTESPKLDGLRVLVTFDANGQPILNSRGNKTYPCPQHIKEQLVALKEETGFDCFDGELIILGMPLQQIVSLAKKPQQGSENLNYYIFDIPSDKKWFTDLHMISESTYTYGDCRCSDLSASVGFTLRDKNKYPNLFVVPANICQNEEEAKASVSRNMAEGYEGSIFRNLDGLYEYGQRSSDLLKWKLFCDTEAYVTSCEEDKNAEGVLHCVLESGVEFKCKMKGSHEYRLYENQLNLVGKYITVKYQALTVDGVPQFPTGICERDVADWQPQD